jgi:hypothetical protein
MWYFLQTATKKRDTLIEINGSYDRITNYFLSNHNDEKFGKNLSLTAIAQEGFTNKMLSELDYLEDIIMGNIPVFSEKFKNIMSKYLTDKVDFYPCEIFFKSAYYKFYVVKINCIIPIIDYEKSGCRKLTDGSVILSEPTIIKEEIDKELLIVRDAEYTSIVVVSDLFKQIIEKEKLKIGFYNAAQTFW